MLSSYEQSFSEDDQAARDLSRVEQEALRLKERFKKTPQPIKKRADQLSRTIKILLDIQQQAATRGPV